jgi:hypothetical protein
MPQGCPDDLNAYTIDFSCKVEAEVEVPKIYLSIEFDWLLFVEL